jgi:hypothetical protein
MRPLLLIMPVVRVAYNAGCVWGGGKGGGGNVVSMWELFLYLYACTYMHTCMHVYAYMHACIC